MRQVVRVAKANEQLEGEGMLVKRPMPSMAVPRCDPFLLIDHMGPWEHGPGEAKGAPDHPHRGFETVTYLLQGAWEHKDSLGNAGRIEAGGVQWMTAGDGVVHSELPAAEIRRDGGTVEGVQLWVNLPKKDKRMRPRYQDVLPDAIPEVAVDGGTVRVIAGAFRDAEAVIDTRTPITMLHARLGPGARVRLPVPPGHAGFVYTLAGDANVGGEDVAEHHLGLLGDDGDEVDVAAGDDGVSLLLLTGVPLREPVVQWGPFVMTERQEILEAVRDYEAGRMGTIQPEGA